MGNRTESADVESMLLAACERVATRIVQSRRKALPDPVAPLARSFCEIALRHLESVRTTRGDPYVVICAVYFIASFKELPAPSDDRTWFRSTLAALLNVAIPQAPLSEKEHQAANFLAAMLTGIDELLVEHIVDVPLRWTHEDTETEVRLREAGLNNRCVYDLMCLLEKIRAREVLDMADQKLYQLAVATADFVRKAPAAPREDDAR